MFLDVNSNFLKVIWYSFHTHFIPYFLNNRTSKSLMNGLSKLEIYSTYILRNKVHGKMLIGYITRIKYSLELNIHWLSAHYVLDIVIETEDELVNEQASSLIL